MLIKMVIVFISILLVRGFYYFYYFLLARRYLSKYMHYVKEQKDWYVSDHKYQIVDTIKKAGVANNYFPLVEPVGFNHVRTATINLFDNFDSLRKDIVTSATVTLRQAKTNLLSKTLNSINPMYWIEVFIFLPRELMSYFGVPVRSILVQTLQFLWWLLSAIGLIVGLVFNAEFRNWITLIKK